MFSSSISTDWWEQMHNSIETEDHRSAIKLAKEFNEKNPSKKSFCHDHDDINPDIKSPIQKQHFFTDFHCNDIIRVQLSADIQEGFLSPIIQLVSVTKSIDFCIEHKQKPHDCYNSKATKPVKEPGKKYDNFREYLEIWLPLLSMETINSSVTNCDENFVIRNCEITWFVKETRHPVTKHYEKFWFGKLRLSEKSFNTEFIDINENTLAAKDKENPNGHPSFALSFACIQYKDCKSSEKSSQFYRKNLNSDFFVDNYTWVGHCVVTLFKIVGDDSTNLENHKGLKKRNITEIKTDNENSKDRLVDVYLAFPNVNQKIPHELFGRLCNIELMRKPYPDSVIETALRSILISSNKVSDLCREIVLGGIVDRKKMDFSESKLNNYIEECIDKAAVKAKLNKPNKIQFEAILNAFKQHFSLIQGPPGSLKYDRNLRINFSTILRFLSL